MDPSLDPINYVYQKEAGEGIIIYHVEMGCTSYKKYWHLRKDKKGKRNKDWISRTDKLRREYPSARIRESILTQTAKDEGLKKIGDEGLQRSSPQGGDPSHSTCVIQRAAGTTGGAANKATVQPIKIGKKLTLDNVAEGLETAVSTIKSDETAGKAIVLLTSGFKKEMDSGSAIDSCRDSLKELVKMGVPIVASAGNSAQSANNRGLRKAVDTYPPVLGNEIPMIVVGNVNWDGTTSPSSQGQDDDSIRNPDKALVQIHAMGVGITCLDKYGKDDGLPGSGTSYSAPLVAGQLAVLMSTNDPMLPFHGKTGEDFVRSAKKFIEDVAQWKRPSGTSVTERDGRVIHGQNKVLWNGVSARIQEYFAAPEC
ncbi:peptidase S8/S53 domain-containing protein [Penicillium alfredii]|uniref:Peptidase S8/S53 domain-containing protein n=1 Tax=Penicillium alfredii TaxID=1506179 RepID=A0A9W9FRT9_9EURO|nr:peptidase S8/S53 domain-containing protein [Penicillium alfredii]KAJ5105177.1 peptidase S8/S53 domain-containing protein [Penicillium alfredii]